jgi:L-fuconolactonase
MIIDTHTHFYDPFRPEGVPWPPKENKLLYRTVLPEHLKPLAEPDGVVGTVVVEASKWLEDNQWILDLASELTRFAASPFFRGIRIGGGLLADMAQGSFLDDMALLAEKDLSLDALIFDPAHFAGLSVLAERVPDLRIVVNHVGNMPIDGAALDPAWVERFQKAAAHPNVHMKVSGLLENSVHRPAPLDVNFYRPLLDCLWAAFGEKRLLYGSNWPVCEQAGDYAGCVSIVRSYFGEKGEEASANYFWRNAKAVYKWIERG